MLCASKWRVGPCVSVDGRSAPSMLLVATIWNIMFQAILDLNQTGFRRWRRAVECVIQRVYMLDVTPSRCSLVQPRKWDLFLRAFSMNPSSF